MSDETHALFVSCAPGLEALLVSELAGLGLDASATAGGAAFTTDAEGLYRTLLGCGLGLRVLLRVATFKATKFTQLERELRQLDWAKLIPAKTAVRVKAAARKSRLYHSGAVAERVQLALAAAVGATAQTADDGSALIVQARLERDVCTLSLDLCGSPMQQRGYRLASGKAPLREDLARALLLLAGFDGTMPLVDPMCGSGTLPIEASLLATGRAPGLLRDFAVRSWPMHDAAAEQQARAFLTDRERTTMAPIAGGDRDQGAIRCATENANRAGLSMPPTFHCQPLSATRLPVSTANGGLIVCNPPYGHRIGHAAKLRDLYAALGQLRQTAPPGYRLALVTSNAALAQATGVPLRSVLMTDLGGLKVRLYVE